MQRGKGKQGKLNLLERKILFKTEHDRLSIHENKNSNRHGPSIAHNMLGGRYHTERHKGNKEPEPDRDVASSWSLFCLLYIIIY